MLFILVFFTIGFSHGQPTDFPDDPEANPVPITGIEYLLAAGAAFGAKKIFDRKKLSK